MKLLFTVTVRFLPGVGRSPLATATRVLLFLRPETPLDLLLLLFVDIFYYFIVKLLCCFIVDCGEKPVVVVHQSWRAKCLISPLFQYLHTRTVLKYRGGISPPHFFLHD